MRFDIESFDIKSLIAFVFVNKTLVAFKISTQQ